MLKDSFEVAVIRDATAVAVLPDLDGYPAALVNFRLLASAARTTDEATWKIEASAQYKDMAGVEEQAQ